LQTHNPVVALVSLRLARRASSGKSLLVGHAEVEAITADDVVEMARDSTGVNDRVGSAFLSDCDILANGDIYRPLAKQRASAGHAEERLRSGKGSHQGDETSENSGLHLEECENGSISRVCSLDSGF
jgi:hypothetical protein